MKSFANTSFFLLFEAIVRHDNAGLSMDAWKANGVEWNRTHHNFGDQRYGFTVEVFLATRPGRNGWSFMVVKEHWWAGRHGESVKSQNWAKLMSGKRSAVMAWLTERKGELEK
jgi:hypothetical protein